MMVRSRPRPEWDSRSTGTSPAEAFRTRHRLSALTGRGLSSHTAHVALNEIGTGGIVGPVLFWAEH